MKTTVCVVIATIILASCDAVKMECPTLCECTMENNTTYVACTFKQLQEIPNSLPTNASVLDLRGNWISSLTNVFHNFTEVQILDLSFNNITELKIENFVYMTRLRHLNLEGNQISNLGQDVFHTLQHLKVLNLANNSIGSIHSAIFLGLHQLHSLNLSANFITDPDEDANLFPNTTSTLDLSNNVIRVLSDKLFHNLLDLQLLNLQHNSIKILDGNVFPEYNNLTELDVSHNSISKVVSTSSFSGILVLDLSSNNLTDTSELQLDQFANLVNLTLDGNPLVSFNTPIFSKLHNLQYLSLSRMPKLTYLSKTTFVGLTTLTELKLCNNSQLSFIHKELFIPVSHASIIDLSFNNITSLYKESFQDNSQLQALSLMGNKLTCDCAIEWIVQDIQNRSSYLVQREFLDCVMPDTSKALPVMDLEPANLFCGDVKILNHSGDSKLKIGHPAILKCEADSFPSPEIVWITPRKRTFKYHDFHKYARLDYLPLNTSHAHLLYHHTHVPEDQPSYYSVSETDPNRILVLEDGSLYIDFVMRSDAGPYTCIARNPHNTSQVVITVTLDVQAIQQTYLWSLVVGLACAASFFVLNLTYSLTLAGVRRCISQRRRERIRQIIESMDQYKTQHLGRIKENYHHQVGRIRDQYHYQLGRLREHHQNQMGRMGRMREGASQKVEKLRENYNNQLGRLKEYSSDQLSQIRDRYNNQIDKIKDYGSDKLDKIHEKYKLKQQHVIKLLEMMNFDNCRTVFESECVRTESMILQSDIFNSDIPIHSPIDSASVSDSEYMTATSSESSKYNSHEKLDNKEETEHKTTTSIHPYLPESEEDSETDTAAHDVQGRGNSPVKIQGDQTEVLYTPTRQEKRRLRRQYKRTKNEDQITHLLNQPNVSTEDESTFNRNSDIQNRQRDSDSEQLKPLLVRCQDENPSARGFVGSSQGLLHENGADISHVVVDMPAVSVDDVRETVV